MRICQLELKHFRGIDDGIINLPEHGVLLGSNNAGKSTAVEALALLFGRERMVSPISDWDFHGGSPKPESRFYIIATITGFRSDDPTMVPEWFLRKEGPQPVWWKESDQTVLTDADPPPETSLATRVAMAGRFESDSCEFETVRYFYHGESDPFTDGFSPIPGELLRQVGVFLLSSNRDWDRLLSFRSSSLLKVLREYDALPGSAIEELKRQLREDVAKVEDSEPLSQILGEATRELQSFLLIGKSSRLAYRPTSLDTLAVLQGLVAHIADADGVMLPVAKHGAGMVSLQAFLLLLAFAEHRRKSGHNFILAAEEPELHLHPSLHQRLVHRIRAASVQSIITTQSPHVASGYQPQEVVLLSNTSGSLTAQRLRSEPLGEIPSNSVRNLYLTKRADFYEALMGGVVLVPEGIYDFEWLLLWQRLAQSSPESAGAFSLRPVTILPTSDAAIIDSFAEISKFRPDATPLIDGDEAGLGYLTKLEAASTKPLKVIRYGEGAGSEYLAAWILEPSLRSPGPALSALLPNAADRTLSKLQDILTESTPKKDRDLRERLVWESLSVKDCCLRAGEFFHDVSAIVSGVEVRNSGWLSEVRQSGVRLFTAKHLGKA